MCLAPSQRMSLGPSESKTHLENRYENRSKIGPGSSSGAPKIDLKSVPGPTRDAQWRSGTSRSRLGASRERPRRAPGAPGESPRTARDAKRRPGTLRRGPRRPKSTPSRVRKRKNRVFFARLVREASSDRFFDDFYTKSDGCIDLPTLTKHCPWRQI